MSDESVKIVTISNDCCESVMRDENMFDLEDLANTLNLLIQTFIPEEMSSYKLHVSDVPREKIQVTIEFEKDGIVGFFLGRRKRNLRAILQWLRNQQAYKHDRYIVITTVEPDGTRQDHISKDVSKICNRYRRKGLPIPKDIYLTTSAKYITNSDGERLRLKNG